MKPRIDDFEIYDNFSLLIPEGRSAKVPLLIDSWHLEIEIVFENVIKDGAPAETGVDVTGIGPNHVILKLRNWTNALGTSLNSPVLLGTTGVTKTNIYFLIAHWKVGKVEKVELQIMLGGSDA